MLPLEKYFPDSEDIEFIQKYNSSKYPFLINDKPEGFFYKIISMKNLLK